MQSAVSDIFRHFFLQAEAVGQFSGFVTAFPFFFLIKPEVPNFGALACKLGEFFIQNSLPWFTYNIPGTSWPIFIGFYGIEFLAGYEGSGLSYPLVRPRPLRMSH